MFARYLPQYPLCKKIDFKEFCVFSEEVKKYLNLRLGKEIREIFLHHEQVFSKNYRYVFEQSCCGTLKKTQIRKQKVTTLYTATNKGMDLSTFLVAH